MSVGPVTNFVICAAAASVLLRSAFPEGGAPAPPAAAVAAEEPPLSPEAHAGPKPAKSRRQRAPAPRPSSGNPAAAPALGGSAAPGSLGDFLRGWKFWVLNQVIGACFSFWVLGRFHAWVTGWWCGVPPADSLPDLAPTCSIEAWASPSRRATGPAVALVDAAPFAVTIGSVSVLEQLAAGEVART